MDRYKDPVTSVEGLIVELQALADAPGESPGLSELDHALQCAAELRALAPLDLELQVAGLLHDLGHSRCAIDVHAEVGAEAVRLLMGERVAYLISAHADAKRYLVSTRPDYLARLSPVSRESFELQGGLMTAAEVQRFASHPDVDKAVLLRRADDAAKSAGRPVPGLEAWVEALRATARTVP